MTKQQNNPSFCPRRHEVSDRQRIQKDAAQKGQQFEDVLGSTAPTKMYIYMSVCAMYIYIYIIIGIYIYVIFTDMLCIDIELENLYIYIPTHIYYMHIF